jgi:aryl-alcohol dehydrogenase-like predicted oxidoreductase
VLLSLRPDALLIPGTSSVRHLAENFAVSEIESDQQARNELAACGLAAKDRYAASGTSPGSSGPFGAVRLT